MGTTDELALARTRTWLRRAVIGLNLCPFAKAVEAKGQIRFVVDGAEDAAAAMAALERELDALAAADPVAHDTTLLVLPRCLDDFLEFDALCRRGERLIRKRGLEGEIQLAAFHPHFQFAGSDEDDVANCTNRSPYPTLHLLREASVERAVRAFPDASAIYQANVETLRRLGTGGWQALAREWS